MTNRFFNTVLERQYNQIESNVPIGVFLSYVSDKTGWTQEELLNDIDLGEVEEKLDVKSTKPTDSKGIKRGKSPSDLYKFVSDTKRKQVRNYVDELIAK